MHSTPTYNIKLEDDLRELNNKVALLMDKFTTSERAQQSALQASVRKSSLQDWKCTQD